MGFLRHALIVRQTIPEVEGRLLVAVLVHANSAQMAPLWTEGQGEAPWGSN